MVPVDAPNPYHSANCLCVQSILKLMQEKETGLNVFLLDMCRKRYNAETVSMLLESRCLHDRTGRLVLVLSSLLMPLCCFRNLHDEVMPNVMLKVTANIVFGYAT